MRRASVALASLALASLASPREARANVEATEFWGELGVRIIPARRLRLTLSNGVRVTELYGLRRFIPELEVDYRVVGPLRFGVGYRYLWRRDGRGDVEVGHRIHGEATLQLSVRRVDFELRSRVQWRTVAQNDSGFLWDDDRTMWRNRLNVEWKVRRPLTLSAFAEHWTRLDTGFAHDRLRAGASVAVEVSRWRFELFYQRDMLQVIDQPNVNMVGLNARLTLDLVRP